MPKAGAPLDSDSDEIADSKVAALIDNRRQVDFHILLLTTGPVSYTHLTLPTTPYV